MLKFSDFMFYVIWLKKSVWNYILSNYVILFQICMRHAFKIFPLFISQHYQINKQVKWE